MDLKIRAGYAVLLSIAATITALTDSWEPMIVTGTAVLFFEAIVLADNRYRLTWTYRCDDLAEELQGWRKPVWRGSDDWPGDTTYWRSTIAFRAPGRRYLVIAIPVRRAHKDTR